MSCSFLSAWAAMLSPIKMAPPPKQHSFLLMLMRCCLHVAPFLAGKKIQQQKIGIEGDYNFGGGLEKLFQRHFFFARLEENHLLLGVAQIFQELHPRQLVDLFNPVVIFESLAGKKFGADDGQHVSVLTGV